MQALLTDLSSLNHSRSPAPVRVLLPRFHGGARPLLRRFLRGRPCNVHVPPGPLPSPSSGATGSGCGEVFLNLLRNAGEAVDGAGSICLDASFLPAGPRAGDGPSAPGEACILVTVRDTGCGIPKEQLSHIFEPSLHLQAERHGAWPGHCRPDRKSPRRPHPGPVICTGRNRIPGLFFRYRSTDRRNPAASPPMWAKLSTPELVNP